MTVDEEKKEAKHSLRSKVSLIFFVFFTTILFIYNTAAKEGFVNGLRFSALTVIPAVFPFFILADFLLSYFQPKENVFSRTFEKLFGISSQGFKAYLIGIVCGFPLGVKCASELYKQKKITLTECERLSSVASSPSLAFVISGIGLGLRGSITDGIILYFCVIISSALTGLIFKKKEQKIEISNEISEQNFSLADSVKKAAYSSISVSAYISFFSIIIFLLGSMVENDLLTLLFSAFFEIGNASVLISNSKILSPDLSFSLTAFALAFSGLSVFMQGMEYLPEEASKLKILFMKIFQGVIALLTSTIILRLF